MSEELPPIPENATAAVPAAVPAPQKQSGIVLGILSIVCSVFCLPVGLILGIIGLCTYPAKSTGKLLSIIGLAISGLILAAGVAYGVFIGSSLNEIQTSVRANHPEMSDTEFLEYLHGPEGQKEVEKAVEESMSKYLK